MMAISLPILWTQVSFGPLGLAKHPSVMEKVKRASEVQGVCFLSSPQVYTQALPRPEMRGEHDSTQCPSGSITFLPLHALDLSGFQPRGLWMLRVCERITYRLSLHPCPDVAAAHFSLVCLRTGSSVEMGERFRRSLRQSGWAWKVVSIAQWQALD